MIDVLPKARVRTALSFNLCGSCPTKAAVLNAVLLLIDALGSEHIAVCQLETTEQVW